MFEFDSGSTGSGGPYVKWHVKASEDGAAAAKSFSLKAPGEDAPRTDITKKFEKGVVLDIDNMRTGWSNYPEWQWNQTLARFAPKPGDDWKKGFLIPVALGKEESGVWLQSDTGAFMAISELAKKLKQEDREGDKLPVVRMFGTFDVEFPGGKSTTCAKLEITKWVDRPDCLINGADDDNITGLADDTIDELGDDDEF